MMDLARIRADAGSMANRPALSDVIFMSVLVDHQRRIQRLHQIVKKQQATIKELKMQLEEELEV